MSEANYNKQSVACVRHPYPTAREMNVQPGMFCWSPEENGERYLYICLPGMNRLDAIHVKRGDAPGNRTWGWDGNEDQPTLSPSLHWVGHWHGWLRAGQLVSC